MSIRKCWVNACQSSANREQDRGVTYHKLPKNALSQKKWLLQAHLSADTDKKRCFICSRHFRKVDFELYKTSKFVLKADAIPTIFSWGVTPLEDLDNIFASLDSSKLPPDISESEENTITSDKDKMDESICTENIPVCDNKQNEVEAQDKIDNNCDETKVLINKIDVTENPCKEEVIEPILNITPDTKETNPTPDIADVAKLTNTQNIINTEIIPENNSTPPEIETIFENLFQEQKLNLNLMHSDEASFLSKTSSDDDKVLSEDHKESGESIKNPLPTPQVKRAKLPVGRPRRRSPNSHKSAIPSKKKLERRKRFSNSVATNIDDKNIEPSVKFEKGVLMQGSRVEAKDFNDHWYPARVVEVDHEEMEVLIHYDNWSQRFDEWISMHSSRLRLIDSPSPVSSINPPTYKIGERCLARWSNNQRFPATVRDVLDDGFYVVVFDDTLTRTIKWSMMTKITKPSHRRTASKTPKETDVIAPGIKQEPELLLPSNVPPPTPIHNHLFDPKRDHLGTKEERRHLKRRLDVKELFFNRKKRKGTDKDLSIKKALNLNDGRRRKKKFQLSDGTKTPETSLNIHRPIPKTSPKLNILDMSIRSDSSTISLSPKANSVIMESSMSDVFSTNDKIKSPLRTLMPNSPVVDHASLSASAHTVIKSEYIVKTPLSSPTPICDNIKMEPEEPSIFDPDTSDVKCKLEPALPTANESILRSAVMSSPQPKFTMLGNSPQPYLPKINSAKASDSPNKSFSKLASNFPSNVRISHHKSHTNARSHPNSITPSPKPPRLRNTHLLRAADKDWYCHWYNGQPVGTVLDSEPSKDASVSRVTVQVEDKRLPPNWVKLLTRRTIGSTEGKWDVILVCPSGRRYRTRGEMQERLKETDYAELAPFALGLMDFSAHRKQARRRGLDISTLETKPTLPITPPVALPKTPIPGPASDSLLLLTGLSTPHGNNFVYIGSLKVEIIENLLRCPKEGCFKNFRKENLLQMHIKHYHPELCKFFGDTPNVADLAYARTVVEEPASPVTRVRERRVPETQFAKTDFDNTPIKVENIDTDGSTIYDNRTTLSMNRMYGNDVPVTEDPWNDDNECHENVWHVKQKTPTKGKDQYTGVTLLNISQKYKNSPKSNILDEYNHSHKAYQPEEGEIFNKKEYYQNYDYPAYKYTPPPVKRSHKRKVPVAVEDRFKNKPFSDNPATWNVHTPEHDESRSSFEVNERIGINGRAANDPVKIKDEKEDSNQSTIITETGEKIKIVHMKREEIINCHCRFGEEDGLMIQCELCLCWQHAVCHNIERESEVPEKYICLICLNPYRGRRSQKYLHDQDWLYEGRLPRASRTLHPSDAQRANLLRKSHELAANLLQLKDLMHSLRCKMEVAEKKDHPKLYLWSKPWEPSIDANADKNLNGDLDVSAIKNEIIIPQSEMDLGQLVIVEEDEILKKPLEDVSVEQLSAELPNVDEIISSNLDADKKIDDIKIEPDDSVKYDLPNGSSPTNLFSNMFVSPGGTLDLPLTKSDIETLVKTVQMAVPQPEAAIEPSDCRVRLQQYIERTQNLLGARLDSIEAQIAELESQDPSFEDDESPDHCPRTKQTIQMLLRDLNSLAELGALSC